jgi:hypothetical protein
MPKKKSIFCCLQVQYWRNYCDVWLHLLQFWWKCSWSYKSPPTWQMGSICGLWLRSCAGLYFLQCTNIQWIVYYALALISSFICRHSSVRCSSSKPYFAISVHVTHSEDRIKIKVYNFFEYHTSILSIQIKYILRCKLGGQRYTIFWIFLHIYSQKTAN